MKTGTWRRLRLEMLEARHLLHGVGEMPGSVAGEGETAPMADFTLPDVNPTSPTADQNVSPRDWLGHVSAWYFGSALCGSCTTQFRHMDTLQQELQDTYPLLRIQLLGINERGHAPGNPSATENIDLPWLQDEDTNSDGMSDVLVSWQATFGDVVILDGNNVKVGGFPANSHNLAVGANYAALREMLVDAAMTSQLPWRNPNQPLDVDNNQVITPLDALIVINRLNSLGSGSLPPPVVNQSPPPFYDTSGDNQVTPLDALQVINYLNNRPPVPAGEGESVAAAVWAIGVSPSIPSPDAPWDSGVSVSLVEGDLPDVQELGSSRSAQPDARHPQPGVWNSPLVEPWSVGVDGAFAADEGRERLTILQPALAEDWSELDGLFATAPK